MFSTGIDQPGGNTCTSCRHTFDDHSQLLTHLGLAHGGLLEPFSDYKICGSRILQKAMERHRMTEGRLYYCLLCPNEEFASHEHVVEHVTACHLTETIRKRIELTLICSTEHEQVICQLCFKYLESKLEGILHLQHHDTVLGGGQAYKQLIYQKDRPIYSEIPGPSSRQDSAEKNLDADSSGQRSGAANLQHKNSAADSPLNVGLEKITNSEDAVRIVVKIDPLEVCTGNYPDEHHFEVGHYVPVSPNVNNNSEPISKTDCSWGGESSVIFDQDNNVTEVENFRASNCPTCTDKNNTKGKDF
jgi:hypothetical protein